MVGGGLQRDLGPAASGAGAWTPIENARVAIAGGHAPGVGAQAATVCVHVTRNGHSTVDRQCV